ncbi:hypothetical protein HY030_04330 [Candidatus Gottesmanbacteria bacterium]|nr:hypothetical protein [Candidatus Gottesmanbacteria bacterium]
MKKATLTIFAGPMFRYFYFVILGTRQLAGTPESSKRPILDPPGGEAGKPE